MNGHVEGNSVSAFGTPLFELPDGCFIEFLGREIYRKTWLTLVDAFRMILLDGHFITYIFWPTPSVAFEAGMEIRYRAAYD